MKRIAFSFLNAVAGIAGLLLAAVGVGTMDTDGGRVFSLGLILMGASCLPYRKNIPEWRPEWTGGFAFAFGMGFIILGLVIFLLSLL
ncbi:MAG: hypothetical protein HZB20_00560 [Chloroflexi bacterium]|nr:hypothetical protein [Chloroflexota bacterium]